MNGNGKSNDANDVTPMIVAGAAFETLGHDIADKILARHPWWHKGSAVASLFLLANFVVLMWLVVFGIVVMGLDVVMFAFCLIIGTLAMGVWSAAK